MVNRASESKQPRQCHCWTRGPVAVPTPYSKAWQNMTELTEHWHVFESCNLGLYRSTCYTRAVLSLIHELFTGFWWIQHIHQPSLNRYRTCDVNAYLRAELPKASTLHTLDMRLQFFTNPMKELSRVYDVYALFTHCLCIVYALFMHSILCLFRFAQYDPVVKVLAGDVYRADCHFLPQAAGILDRHAFWRTRA